MVPQCYLNYFVNENGRINVFDIMHLCEYYSSPKDLAVRRDYYRDYLKNDEFIWEEHYSANAESILPKTFDYIINKSVHAKSGEKILTDVIKNNMALIIITQLFRTEKWRYHSYKAFSPEIPLILNGFKEKLQLLEKRCGRGYFSEKGIEAFARNQYLEFANSEFILYTHRQILLDRTWIIFRSIKNKKRIFSSDNSVLLYNIDLDSFDLADNYINDLNNTLFFPISTGILLMILPNNNTQLIDFCDYADCVLDGSEKLFNFHNRGQMMQASRQVFT